VKKGSFTENKPRSDSKKASISLAKKNQCNNKEGKGSANDKRYYVLKVI